jgi:DNA-binding beta-propeller fold protein YncE
MGTTLPMERTQLTIEIGKHQTLSLDPIRASDQLIWACRKSPNQRLFIKIHFSKIDTCCRPIITNGSMKKLFRSLPAIVACFICIIHARADTIYVGCALEGTIHQFTTNGVDSIFARASLGNPQGEAFDRAGNLYVANETYNTITKFSASGVPSTFAFDPGNNTLLNRPIGLAFDHAGNLYVANESDNTIEKFDTNGVPSVFATDDGSYNILNGPEGLAFDTASNLYVANDGDFISKFSPNGTFLGQFGDGSYLNSPIGIAFDKTGNLYVANNEPASDSPTIVKYDASGNGTNFVTTDLDYPEFIAFDTNNNLYVANEGTLATEGNNNIVKFDTNGNSTVFSQYGGTAFPVGLAFDSSGNLYDADADQFIQKFDSTGNSSRFATISIADPRGLGLDSMGNLYVANFSAGNIEKFDTNGVPSEFAFPGQPYGLVVDGSNNVYIANSYFNQILKYTPDAFSSIFGTDDGSGLILNNPWGLAIDSLGNIYAINGNVNTISKFTPNGNGSVFASPADFYTHGPGLAADSSNNIYCLTNFTGIAKFSPAGVPAPFANDPGQSYVYANAQGMAFDSAGNLYVANYYDGTVMKFDKNGNGSVFASGLNTPESIIIKRPNSTVLFIPTLSITPGGTNVVLSWSTAAAGYNLYSKTNLALGNWLAVPGIRGTNLTSFLMTNPITGSSKFFRLSNP